MLAMANLKIPLMTLLLDCIIVKLLLMTEIDKFAHHEPQNSNTYVLFVNEKKKLCQETLRVWERRNALFLQTISWLKKNLLV